MSFTGTKTPMDGDTATSCLGDIEADCQCGTPVYYPDGTVASSGGGVVAPTGDDMTLLTRSTLVSDFEPRTTSQWHRPLFEQIIEKKWKITSMLMNGDILWLKESFSLFPRFFIFSSFRMRLQKYEEWGEDFLFIEKEVISWSLDLGRIKGQDFTKSSTSSSQGRKISLDICGKLKVKFEFQNSKFESSKILFAKHNASIQSHIRCYDATNVS